MFLKYVMHLTASERQFLTRIAKGGGGHRHSAGWENAVERGIGWLKRWRRYPFMTNTRNVSWIFCAEQRLGSG